MMSPAPVEPTPTPYVEPTRDLAGLAARFVREALSYDSCAHDRDTALDRVAELVTRGELRRLHGSPRAHLRWWVLCQRNERADVHVDGVSEEPGPADTTTLQVEVLRTTRSDISTVRDFVHVTLVVVRTPQACRIDRAAGGGL